MRLMSLTHTHTHTHTPTNTNTHTHTHTQTNTHSHALTHTHTHTHPNPHAQTQTRAHTHTHSHKCNIYIITFSSLITVQKQLFPFFSFGILRNMFFCRESLSRTQCCGDDIKQEITAEHLNTPHQYLAKLLFLASPNTQPSIAVRIFWSIIIKIIITFGVYFPNLPWQGPSI